MAQSFTALLEELARPRSRLGGGSSAAMAVAIAAALCEKLSGHGPTLQRLRVIRRQASAFIDQDAKAFARVIDALRSGRRPQARQALKAATGLQGRVFQLAQELQAISRNAKPRIPSRYGSDLQCVMAIAMAAKRSAAILIRANIAWIDEPQYTKRMRRCLQSHFAKRPPQHSGGRASS